MKQVVNALLALGLIANSVPGLAAAPCRDSHGKFVKCTDPATKGVRCKDAKGRYAKCGPPGAKPA